MINIENERKFKKKKKVDNRVYHGVRREEISAFRN